MSDTQADAVTAPGASPGPGDLLAAAREARGLSVVEVAARLKYSPRQIEALEAGRFSALPDATFARGMVRGYAKLVGIDPAPLYTALEAHLRRAPDTVQPANMAVPFRPGRRRESLVYLLASAFVLLVCAGVIVEWWLPAGWLQLLATEARQAVSQRTAAAASAPVAAEAVPPASPAAAEPPAAEVAPEPAAAAKRLELTFAEESWVEIRDGNGKLLVSQLNASGTHRRVDGVAPLSLVIGNASGVKLRYNDKNVDLAPYTRTDVARLTLR